MTTRIPETYSWIPETQDAGLGEKEEETMVLCASWDCQRDDQVSTLGLGEILVSLLPIGATETPKSAFSDISLGTPRRISSSNLYNIW